MFVIANHRISMLGSNNRTSNYGILPQDCIFPFCHIVIHAGFMQQSANNYIHTGKLQQLCPFLIKSICHGGVRKQHQSWRLLASALM
jgi:hypothetical protein